MNEPLVTVVVPIYNVEQQLSRCVDSILNQTYRNLEVILVDDGSPDNCPQICDNYAVKDARIKVIHKENAGLGFARNTGIDNATGKYICFFDSDDYIEPTTVEECCSKALSTDADLVCFGHIEETDEGKIITERLPQSPKDLFVGKEIRDLLIPMTLAHSSITGEDWNLSLSAWCELYSMDVINRHNWRFVSEREIISEDIYSVLEYYSFCDKVAFINKPFYHYISNPCSLSKSYRSDRFDRLKLFADKLFELSEKMNMKKELFDRVKTIFLGLTIGALKQIAASDNNGKEKRKAINTVISDSYMQNIMIGYDYSGEKLFKRVLFWGIKHKLNLLVCAILKTKCFFENRNKG